MDEFSFSVKYLEKCIDAKTFIEKYVDIAKCESYCRTCSQYGKNWACPAYNFSVIDIWKQYKTVWIIGEQLLLSENLQKCKYADDGVAEFIERMFREEKTKLALRLLRLEREYPNSMCLVSDACRMCKKCARLFGKPCRYPALRRYMIEGVGADIEKMSEDLFGIKILWGQDSLPKYYVIYNALLLK